MTPEGFFAAERDVPFRWGHTDCVHTADRWAALHFGRSFVAFSRRDFSTEAEAMEMAAWRAMPVWLGRAMRGGGMRMVKEPRQGDIGAIVAPGRIICAVRGARMWLYRDRNGIGAVPLDARVLGAWSL